MPGLQKIYVDFSVRDPDGRFYVARTTQFSGPPGLGMKFVGTDFDEFEVECEVFAIFYRIGQVWVRPVDADAVPGTAPLPRSTASVPQEAFGVAAEEATGELVGHP
jgi:hypothetical protein